MKTYQIDLKKEYGLAGGTLDCMIADCVDRGKAETWKRPAVIVVPGGGYGCVCNDREGEAIALEFLARGFHAFILNYEVGGENGIPYPEQLLEEAAAVDYVRKHAKEFTVNEKEIFAVGFSAGGHLVGNLAVEHQTVSQKYGKPLDCKPTAVGLCYPVISSKHGHMGSFENLLYGYSDEAKEELLKTLNLDEAVSEYTPPAFIWATAEDTVVPPDNAIRYALALDRQGIGYELHIYPKADHGLATAKEEINIFNFKLKHQYTRAQKWLDDCASFFRIYCEEEM